MTVTAVVSNRAPTAVDDTVDVSNATPASFQIVGNDTDADGPAAGETLVIHSISSASIVFTNGQTGSVTVGPVGRTARIDPAGGLGTATFTYTVRDADGGVSAPATVTVVGPPLNTVPVARDQSVAVSVGESRTLDLDVSDADGDALTVVDLADPNGVVNGQSALTVTILATGPGTFAVTYRVTDGVDISQLATVTIVASPAAPPHSKPPSP